MMKGCDVCGNKDLSIIWTGLTVGRYCSYHCAAIGQRNLNVILSVLFALPWVFLILLPRHEVENYVRNFITIMIFSLFLEIYALYSAYYGRKAYKKSQNQPFSLK